MARILTADVMGTREFIVVIVFGALTTLIVIGRFSARWLRRVHLAANDYMIFIALVTFPVQTRCTITEGAPRY